MRCVKSIVTVVLMFALCVLTFCYPDTYADTFKSCATMVATFYFTHQINKKEIENNGKSDNTF